MGTFLGLSFIIIAWAYELFYVWQKNYKIQPLFVLAYCFGVLILVMDGFLSGMQNIAVLNLLSFIVSFIVFLKLKK